MKIRERQPQFRESLTQLASLSPCGLAAEVWAMAKLNVNQNKFEYLWKLPEVDVERRRGEGTAAEQSKLSVCAKFVNWKIENNEWHAHTHKSLNFAATNTILHWTVNISPLYPPFASAFPKVPSLPSLRLRSETTTTRRVAAGKLCSPVCPSVCVCLCVCVCGCPCGLHI